MRKGALYKCKLLLLLIINVQTGSPQENSQRPVTDLFGVELVELHFLSVFPPQAEHSGLRTVCHVDQLLEPPPVMDHARHAPQQQTVITHLCDKARVGHKATQPNARRQLSYTCVTRTVGHKATQPNAQRQLSYTCGTRPESNTKPHKQTQAQTNAGDNHQGAMPETCQN